MIDFTLLLICNSRQPGALQLLTSLYAGRAHHLWRDVTILPWLERNVHAVLDLVESNAPVIKEAGEKRSRRYQGTPRNVYRHVILSDIKDATTSLPRVILSIFVYFVYFVDFVDFVESVESVDFVYFRLFC